MLELETIGDRLAASLQFDGPLFTTRPTSQLRPNIEPWLLASILQKAIRRGETAVAADAAKLLASMDPVRLWRRLVVIALEDVGIGNLQTAADVVWVSGKRAWRAKLGGDPPIAALLAQRLAQSPKSRDADDLLVWAGMHRDFHRLRRALAHAHEDNLASLVGDASAALPERAIAALYIVGTSRLRGFDLYSRYGRFKPLAAVYEQLGVPPEVVQIAIWAANKQTEAHPVSLPLIWLANQCTPPRVAYQKTPPNPFIENVPAASIDMHTRFGKQAILQYLSESTRIREALGHLRSSDLSARIVGCAVFRAEGHCVDRRIIGPHSIDIIQHADEALVGGTTLSPGNSRSVIEIVLSELPLLNEARRHVLRSNSR